MAALLRQVHLLPNCQSAFLGSHDGHARAARLQRAQCAVANVPSWLQPFQRSSPFAAQAKDRKTGQLVAIKKFVDTDLHPSTNREVQALRRISHPGVCAFIDAFLDAGRLRLVMEFAPGGSLLDLLVNTFPQGIPAPELGAPLRSLIDAVAAIHKCGLIHRDLKPENVLLGGSHPLRVKVCKMPSLLCKWVSPLQHCAHRKRPCAAAAAWLAVRCAVHALRLSFEPTHHRRQPSSRGLPTRNSRGGASCD